MLELPIRHHHTPLEISTLCILAWSAWSHGAGAPLIGIGRHADPKSYQGMSGHYETTSGAIGVNALGYPPRIARMNGCQRRVREIDFDRVFLSRLQFAWVSGWHVMLPAFTFGDAALIAVLGGFHLATARDV